MKRQHIRLHLSLGAALLLVACNTSEQSNTQTTVSTPTGSEKQMIAATPANQPVEATSLSTSSSAVAPVTKSATDTPPVAAKPTAAKKPKAKKKPSTSHPTYFTKGEVDEVATVIGDLQLDSALNSKTLKEGSAVLVFNVFVDANGKPNKVVATPKAKGSDEQFRLGIEALMQANYQPAIKDGQSVASKLWYRIK